MDYVGTLMCKGIQYIDYCSVFSYFTFTISIYPGWNKESRIMGSWLTRDTDRYCFVQNWSGPPLTISLPGFLHSPDYTCKNCAISLVKLYHYNLPLFIMFSKCECNVIYCNHCIGSHLTLDILMNLALRFSITLV